MTRENRLAAPESLPKYLANGLPKQDSETLTDVIEYAEELIEFQNRPIELNDLPDGAEPVEDESNSKKGIIVKEMSLVETRPVTARMTARSTDPTAIGISVMSRVACHRNISAKREVPFRLM